MTVKPLIRAWAMVPQWDWPTGLLDMLAGSLPHPASAMIDPVDLGSCAAEWIRAEAVDTDRAVLYLHGGAFMACGLNTHRSVALRMSAAVSGAVLNVDYRMLPKHAIACAVEDALAGYRWLLGIGYKGPDIVIAGDSAGGYLAFEAVLALRAAGLPAPACLVTFSPLTDVGDMARKQRGPKARECPLLPVEALDAFTRYIERAHRRLCVDGSPGPLANPVEEDLSGMPPVMIQAGSDEMLIGDAELMACRLRRADIRCDLHVWDGQMHAFPAVTGATPESMRAMDLVGDFVADVTGTGGRVKLHAS
ncbi:alpha/beta hydrolase [Speluncibacter jeojiensis]|uniref:Alpha/beta hydrolase n=1 Tax=Speluncibacter jeojiensis TaxID=2710754 RepID=A0A9X4LWM1_9ACTN|nr:alpha/beta hydrolase [Corynebacteriales bacterium D3-21]